MKGFDLWLQNSLQYDELKKCLGKAVAFYGEYMGNALLQHDVMLSLIDDGKSRPLGEYSAVSRFNKKSTITLYNRRTNMHTILDCVFVHELAHFLDNIRVPEEARSKYASCIHGTKERVIAELFRSKIPHQYSRTAYIGQTSECFARAIEEFYAIKTNNSYGLEKCRNSDYYVEIELFKQIVFPVVENYIESL